MKYKNIIKEFIRYVFVGGTAFIVDFILLYLFKTYVFIGLEEYGVYISTALGFLGGLLYNYFLSLIYVFESVKEKNKGKSVGSFVAFSIIGVVGLLLTEFGMFVGIELLATNFMIAKIFVAAVVLIWNYGARKILIFK